VATPLGGIGGYAEYAIAGADSVFRAPPDLDALQSAAFMIPFHTAHLALHRRGGLRAGESLLVHAGAGGVGSAAVQLGVAAGARVFATAGGPEKVAFCKALGAELVIDYRAEDFVPVVLEETGGRGVDVVCDLVGGEIAERSWQCIAREGRYLIAGFSGDIRAGEAGLPPRPVAKGNFSLIGVMMAWIDAPEGALRGLGFNPFGRDVGEAVHEELLALLAAGRIRPLVGATAAFDALPAALEALEERRTQGRSVLQVGG
jgi:NADPH2:quinone reductase